MGKVFGSKFNCNRDATSVCVSVLFCKSKYNNSPYLSFIIISNLSPIYIRVLRSLLFFTTICQQ